MKYGHLERIEMTLRNLAPVFIGSGESLTKKEYIFSPQKQLIYFLDFPKFIQFMKSRGLLAKFERFLTQPRNNDLRVFLEENGVGEKDYLTFSSYSIEAGEAARIPNFREVLTFLKGPDGLPYIPGSSLKGVIRTALLAKLVKTGDWERNRAEIETEANNYRSSRFYLTRESNFLEQKAFYKLGITNPRNQQVLRQPVNDLMRGIQISDSAPLGWESLTLVGKYDRKPKGDVKALPIFRECLIPGSEANVVLTLELPLLKKAGIDLDYIEDALHSFANEHYANFEQYFQEQPEDAAIAAEDGVDLILGGGAGYVSKTINYNLFPNRTRSLPLVAKILSKQFPKHKHHTDVGAYKVSPHTLKTTIYQGEAFQMGRCELIFK